MVSGGSLSAARPSAAPSWRPSAVLGRQAGLAKAVASLPHSKAPRRRDKSRGMCYWYSYTDLGPRE
jgi:hypothetical protein